HLRGAAVVILGSGIGRGEGIGQLAADLAAGVSSPLVIDADALSVISTSLGPIAGRSAPTVLTPHDGEAGRLLGKSSSEVAARRLDSATELAKETGSVVVLKGDDSIVTDGRRI